MNAILKINGQEKMFENGLPETLAELLENLEIDAATVVAEINGQIVERKDFVQTNLVQGQSVELIRFVGGG